MAIMFSGYQRVSSVY